MKRQISILCMLAAVALLVGCGGIGSGVMSVVPVTENPLVKPDYEVDDPQAEQAALGANDFAFRLSAALSQQEQGENLICSPYSVWLPLAALLNATNEQSKPALLEAIGAAGLTTEEVNRAAARMMYFLTKEQAFEGKLPGKQDYYTPLKIANAVFVSREEVLQQSFAQTFADYYKGASINVDFTSPDAAKAVNRWAAENTEGLIKEMVNEFDPNTVAVIANAMYFSDTWQWKFDPEKTEEGVFHGIAEDSKADFMLKQGDGITYYEDERLQAVCLPFGSAAQMTVLLPVNGDGDGLLQAMTADYFAQIHEEADGCTGRLLLPKFEIESELMPLSDILMAMGVPLFEGAPLTGLIEADIPVWLDQAVQKAAIKVDEEGTTAAAVTLMATLGGYPRPSEPFEMVCDKPFVFILSSYTQDGGDQILFTGVVNKP